MAYSGANIDVLTHTLCDCKHILCQIQVLGPFFSQDAEKNSEVEVSPLVIAVDAACAWNICIYSLEWRLRAINAVECLENEREKTPENPRFPFPGHSCPPATMAARWHSARTIYGRTKTAGDQFELSSTRLSNAGSRKPNAFLTTSVPYDSTKARPQSWVKDVSSSWLFSFRAAVPPIRVILYGFEPRTIYTGSRRERNARVRLRRQMCRA